MNVRQLMGAVRTLVQTRRVVIVVHVTLASGFITITTTV